MFGADVLTDPAPVHFHKTADLGFIIDDGSPA